MAVALCYNVLRVSDPNGTLPFWETKRKELNSETALFISTCVDEWAQGAL